MNQERIWSSMRNTEEKDWKSRIKSFIQVPSVLLHLVLLKSLDTEPVPNEEKTDPTTVYDDAHTNMLHINSASTVCKWDWNTGESKYNIGKMGQGLEKISCS